jgi:beta-lactamase superfamily II metal-dependent hydrolase
VLWAGDISPDTEQAVLDLHPGLRTDVLVQGQHSEGPNLSPPWLRQLRPHTVVRPALDYGIDNSLDSPYWNLARELDITTLRMEKTGAIRLVINPENIHIHPHRNPILHPPLP